jgi:HK97 gp10 family phage protein|tara:strand:- start:191 stop:643 length:453 start_codon:yes stop_codon:yes gene_type:complete
MNVNIKINESDLSKLNKKLDKLRAFESQKVSNELGKTGLEIVRLAKRAAPVGKIQGGTLRQSISAQKSGKSINVVANAKYAPYVEFGTGGRVDLDDMLRLGIPATYAAQFKGKGIRDVNLPPRPFFFNSARVGFKNLLNRLTGEINKAIN